MNTVQLPGAILYVAAPEEATEADRIAEVEVTACVPDIEIERVHNYMEISTPRVLFGKSFYKGLDSIRSLLEYETRQQNKLR